jgi:hypothetical protein
LLESVQASGLDLGIRAVRREIQPAWRFIFFNGLVLPDSAKDSGQVSLPESLRDTLRMLRERIAEERKTLWNLGHDVSSIRDIQWSRSTRPDTVVLPLFWPHLRLEAPSTLRVSPQVAGLATRVTLDARTV